MSRPTEHCLCLGYCDKTKDIHLSQFWSGRSRVRHWRKAAAPYFAGLLVSCTHMLEAREVAESWKACQDRGSVPRGELNIQDICHVSGAVLGTGTSNIYESLYSGTHNSEDTAAKDLENLLLKTY